MRAIVYDQYGPPDVLRLEEQAAPELRPGMLLIEVHATSVTTADWRFRAAEFGAGLQTIGRLISGVFGPRRRLTGREFSGRVVATGAGATRFSPGDEVFGVNPSGVNAEVIQVRDDAAIVRKPASLSHAEAVALPFGAITAAVFLEDMARVQPGERVLVVGASGGVGVYAVQLAATLGATVTGVCSTRNVELVRSLGAHTVIDYTEQSALDVPGEYDVILDCVGKTTFAAYKHKLTRHGRHAFVEAGPREIWQSFSTRWSRGPTVLFGVALDNRESVERVARMIEGKAIAPVIGDRFAMTDVVGAHRLVESRHRRGAVVLDWPSANHAAQPQAQDYPKSA